MYVQVVSDETEVWLNIGRVEGVKGDKGDKGDTGATGTRGLGIYRVNNNLATSAYSVQWASVVNRPSDNKMRIGDLILSQNGNLFRCKELSSYTASGTFQIEFLYSIKGPQGNKGLDPLVQTQVFTRVFEVGTESLSIPFSYVSRTPVVGESFTLFGSSEGGIIVNGYITSVSSSTFNYMPTSVTNIKGDPGATKYIHNLYLAGSSSSGQDLVALTIYNTDPTPITNIATIKSYLQAYAGGQTAILYPASGQRIPSTGTAPVIFGIYLDTSGNIVARAFANVIANTITLASTLVVVRDYVV